MYLFTGYDENNPLKTVISRGEADGNKCYPGGQFNKHAKILIISLYFLVRSFATELYLRYIGPKTTAFISEYGNILLIV